MIVVLGIVLLPDFFCSFSIKLSLSMFWVNYTEFIINWMELYLDSL